MSTNVRTSDNGFGASSDDSDPRPRYIHLGDDSVGHTHYYCTATESIRVVDGRVQVDHFDVARRPVDDYVRFVRDDLDRDWIRRNYQTPEESWASPLSRQQ